MALVSTGQITIVDNNDARPITAFLQPSISVNQIYSKDESSVVYTPDYVATPLVLTPKVYVGGTSSASEVTAQLSNRKWSNDLVTSIGSGVTLSVNTNLTTGAPNKTYYFEGDYTDPVTGLVSHVVCSIVASLIRTGTNAVFVNVVGQNVIQESSGSVKNSVALTAQLIRASGMDDSGVTYKWFEMPGNTEINTSLSGYATKYGFRTTAQANAGSGSAIGTGVPVSGYADTKGILISENAVSSVGLYRVEAKDADGTVYQTQFTVYDVSDPYETHMISTAGDKLQNGVGSTDIYPEVWCGANKVADQTGWSFKYYFFDRNGNQGGFIDTSRTAQAGGRNITSHTTGAAAVITYDGTAITFANNDMAKLVTAGGEAYYYEVASGTGNTVTLRAPGTTSTFLTLTVSPAPVTNQFVGGKLFVCTGTGATAGTQTKAGSAAANGAKITVTGDEIDAKGKILVQSTRP